MQWQTCLQRCIGCCKLSRPVAYIQDDHLSGKPEDVREFDSCQGNVRDFTKNREMSGKKSCRGKVA